MVRYGRAGRRNRGKLLHRRFHPRAYAGVSIRASAQGATLNTTPRKCLDYRTPIEAFLAELCKDVTHCLTSVLHLTPESTH